MSAWAKPGVKCVCVRLPKNPKTKLVLGRVYTVKSVAPYRDIEGNEGLELIEVTPVLHPRYFIASHFRPLITKTQDQDVALFTHLLEGKPVEVDA